jgi:hypothetical protein
MFGSGYARLKTVFPGAGGDIPEWKEGDKGHLQSKNRPKQK